MSHSMKNMVVNYCGLFLIILLISPHQVSCFPMHLLHCRKWNSYFLKVLWICIKLNFHLYLTKFWKCGKKLSPRCIKITWSHSEVLPICISISVNEPLFTFYLNAIYLSLNSCLSFWLSVLFSFTFDGRFNNVPLFTSFIIELS